ncbi:MAG: hypothetical protein P8X74_03415 [Reinekea sp.]|jgi:hypothetical protein
MGRITLVTSLSALICLVAFLFWYPMNLVLLAVYGAVLAASVVLALLFYVVTGYARRDQHNALLAHEVEREKQLYQEVQTLEQQLTDLQQPDSARQADRLMGMLEDYRRVIEQKLGSTTITMTSYSQETGRVFRLVINNLNDILAAAQSVHTTRQEEPDEDLLESEALQRRHVLLTQQEARIDNLVEQNRELLTVLNETTVQVANIQDINSFELKESLQRLRELGERAQSFSKT